jgi:hypothetical protein
MVRASTTLQELEEFTSLTYVRKAKKIERLAGGANNKVFLLQHENQSWTLKKYFSHPNDKRNRLRAEYDFLSFLHEKNIGPVPIPVCEIPDKNAAVYTFIQGSKIDHPKTHHVNQALDFFAAINKVKDEAKNILPASDACFSIFDFVYCTDKRFKRFLQVSPSSGLEEEVQRFIEENLYHLWETIRKEALTRMSEDLSCKEKCLTPSDFGFHNILVHNERCHFLDFEYAGWDDPVKTMADFFLQPKIPVPMDYFEKAKKVFFGFCQDPDDCNHRLEIIFPVCQIKWLCIMLNSVTTIGKQRRLFSNTLDQIDHEKLFNHVKQLYKKYKETYGIR